MNHYSGWVGDNSPLTFQGLRHLSDVAPFFGRDCNHRDSEMPSDLASPRDCVPRAGKVLRHLLTLWLQSCPQGGAVLDLS